MPDSQRFCMDADISISFQGFPGITGHGCSGPGTTLKVRLAVPIQSFSRIQTGFLASADCHLIWKMFIYLHDCRFVRRWFWIFEYVQKFQHFSLTFIALHLFQWAGDFGAYVLKSVSWHLIYDLLPRRNRCSIPGLLLGLWWLFIDFHGVSYIFIISHVSEWSGWSRSMDA